MPVIDAERLAEAATAASPELQAKASAVLAHVELPNEAGAVAAAGAVMVSVLGKWAAQVGLLAPGTAEAVEALAGQAVEALQAVAFADG